MLEYEIGRAVLGLGLFVGLIFAWQFLSDYKLGRYVQGAILSLAYWAYVATTPLFIYVLLTSVAESFKFWMIPLYVLASLPVIANFAVQLAIFNAYINGVNEKFGWNLPKVKGWMHE